MTRKSFNRLRGLGVLSVVAILALGATLLYFAKGSAWLHKPELIATPAAPNISQPVPPTAMATPTVTSVWSAPAPTRAPTPTPESSVVTMTTTRVNIYIEQDGDPRIRFVHASPDAPPLDIYVDGIKAFEQQAFHAVTPYMRVPSGTHSLRTVTSDGAVLLEAKINALPQHDYSIVAVNRLRDIKPIVLNDDNTLPEYGDIRMRVANVSTAGDVLSATLMSSKMMTSTLAFGRASRYGALKAGAIEARFQSGHSAPIKEHIDASKIEMGTVYTMWVFGSAGGLVGDVAVSQDAFKFYVLLPETGGDQETRR